MYQSRANAYRTVGVQSASPERILDEVFQRLQLDCQRALAAIESDDVKGRSEQIGHAVKLAGALEVNLDSELTRSSAPTWLACTATFGLVSWTRTSSVTPGRCERRWI